MKKRIPESPLQPGDFPFPLTHSAKESPLLTWLRNHSNYMAVRGTLDYLRIAAILIRGVVINSLVTLPFLLLIAIVIGLLYGTLLRDWDEELAPSDERNKALHDMAIYEGLRGDRPLMDPDWRLGLVNNGEWLSRKERYERAKGRMERRRWSAQIHFFLSNLETTQPLIRQEDFEKLDVLAGKIEPNDEAKKSTPEPRPIDKFIAGRLERIDGQKALTAIRSYYSEKSTGNTESKRKAEADLRDNLSDAFNVLLHDPLLYNKERFDHSAIALRPGTKLLLKNWKGASDVTIGGFTDLPSLASQLKEGLEPSVDPSTARARQRNPARDIDIWLAKQLSPTARKALAEYQGVGSDPESLKKELAKFFEGVVHGPAIYRECGVDSIDRLQPKTQLLLDLFRQADGHLARAEQLPPEVPAYGDVDNTVRLNRLIIEDAFPVELWWRVGGVDLARLNRRLLEDAYPGELHQQRGGWVMWMQDHLKVCPPFVLTPLVLVLAIAWVLWYPVHTVLARISGYRRSLQTGTESSVKLRDRLERTFGAALLAVLAVALFELLPLIVHFYHQFRVTHLDDNLPWRHYLGAAGAIYSVLAGAEKLTSALSGVWRKLAVFAIGSLGLAAPFMVIVAATDFLVYFELPDSAINIGIFFVLLGLIPILYTVMTVAALVIGRSTRAFSLREARGAIKLWSQAVGIHLLIAILFVTMAVICWKFPDYVPGFLVCMTPVGTELHAVNLSAPFVGLVAVELLFFCWLTVDVNLTSVHGLYRDRLASAYLLRLKPVPPAARASDAPRVAEIEDDIPLSDLCRHDAKSTAPYHLINVALNLQSSKDLNLRDRKSDFFIFSKKFFGGERTSYCRTATLEQVFPQIDLASAMAISAGAASPNMGRNTVPILVPLLTFINLRLGVWVPHPGVLAGEVLSRDPLWSRQLRTKGPRVGYGFDVVFREELVSVAKRWPLLAEQQRAERQLSSGVDTPSAAHRLAGIGFSGGGIRSATVNLGIAQALHDAGVFDHFDYMSTVSGGGYLGSSISTFMRYRVSPNSEIAGTVEVKQTDQATIVVVKPDSVNAKDCTYEYHSKTVLDVKSGDRVHAGQPLVRRSRQLARSEIAGRVTVQDLAHGATLVRVANDSSNEAREYRFESHERVSVKTGQSVAVDEPLVENLGSFINRFRWRVRPRALRWEMLMRLDETHRWVNVSDGGHIENLATIELLRRRCKLIVVGDGEADPEMHFNGLATLIRTAQIDLGITIDINVDALRLDDDRKSKGHFAIGRITYPADTEGPKNTDEAKYGYLLYLKSSVTGDEGEVIWEYRHRNPAFPQEPTADQFFDEGQFEAYRALGQHMGESALAALAAVQTGTAPDLKNFPQLVGAFEALWAQYVESEAKNPTTAK